MKSLNLFLVLFFIACSSSQAIISKTAEREGQCFISSEELRNWSFITNNQYLNNQDYEVIYDNKNIQPFMVSYKLKYSKNTHILNRKYDFNNRFLPDKRVSLSATDKDYKKSGWDKGHLAPSKDFSFNEEAAESTFLYSNISPQDVFFNRSGAWKKLEVKARIISLGSKEPIQIISGPIVTKNIRIKDETNSPAIPDYFFKIIVKFDGTNCSYSGFVFKNSPQSKDICKDRVQNDLIPSLLKEHFKNASAKEFDICIIH